jgi:lipid-A-disaccharide synthase
LTHVFLVAAEASGDALGADVIDALMRIERGVRVSAIGGEQMAARAERVNVDMSGLAVLGLLDGVKAYGRVREAVEAAAAAIATCDPDAVVLIDSWGFMWRLARALKERGVRAKRIKLVGPQVWATRPGRARVLATWTDHLLCIHDFEPPFYERWGLSSTVIGNPALGRLPAGDSRRFRASHPETGGHKIIGLLPGSRTSEIRRVAPVLAKAAERLIEARKDCRVVCVAAKPIEAQLRETAARWAFPHTIVAPDEAGKADAFAAMDVALACSGTVTTEAAAQGAPLVVGYKLGWVTWGLARAFLMRSRYITLLNVAAGREVVPEFVQTRFTVRNVASAAERLLSDPAALAEQRRGQRDALRRMQGPNGAPAAETAAGAILRLARP